MKYIMEQTILSLLLTNPNPAAYTVQVDPPGYNWNYHYAPQSLTIRAGDTVTWVNMQDSEHNIVLERAPKDAEYFESQPLKKIRDRWSYQFTMSGTYVYYCNTHPDSESAVIIVDRPSMPFQMHDVEKPEN